MAERIDFEAVRYFVQANMNPGVDPPVEEYKCSISGSFDEEHHKQTAEVFSACEEDLDSVQYLSNSVLPLMSLHHLKLLSVPAVMIQNGLLQVIKQNPKLENLTINFRGNCRSDGDLDDWKVLASLKQIKSLHIRACNDVPHDLTNFPKFNHLEELIYQMSPRKSPLGNVMLRHMGSQLKRLRTYDHQGKGLYDLKIWPNIDHLHQLEDIQTDHPVWLDTENALECLRKLKSLKRFTYLAALTHVDILKAAPQLEELNNRKEGDRCKAINEADHEELFQYLRASGRSLKFNGSEIP